MKKIISIILAACLVCGAIFSLSVYTNIFGNNKSGNKKSNSVTPDIVDIDTNSETNYAMPAAMTFTVPTAQSTSVGEGVTITATVTPDYATNKAVDWSVAWVNPLEDWAIGKTPADYVTVTPSEDGSRTAVVKCLDAFGSKIKIVVTSRSNNNVTANTVVNFAKTLLGTNINYDFGGFMDNCGFNVGSPDVMLGFLLTSITEGQWETLAWLDYAGLAGYSCSIAPQSSSVGTIENELTSYEVFVTITSQEFKDYLAAAFNEEYVQDCLSYDHLRVDLIDGKLSLGDLYRNMFAFGGNFIPLEEYDVYSAAFRELNGAVAFELDIVSTPKYGQVITNTYSCSFDPAALFHSVTDIIIVGGGDLIFN